MTNVSTIVLNAQMNISGVETSIKQIQSSLKGLTLPKGLSDGLETSFSKLTPLLKDYQKQLNKLGNGSFSKKDLQNFEATRKAANDVFNEIISQINSVNAKEIRLKVDTKEIANLEKSITAKAESLQKALSGVFRKGLDTNVVNSAMSKMAEVGGRSSNIRTLTGNARELFNTQQYAAYNAEIDKLQAKILSLNSTKLAFGQEFIKNFDQIKDKPKEVQKAFEDLFNGLKVNEGKASNIENLRWELSELQEQLDTKQYEALQNAITAIENSGGKIGDLKNNFNGIGEAVEQAGHEVTQFQSELSQLQSSTQYFFSLRNMINLFKRGVREAVSTVKELDAAMTETAVVTEYSVSDMWKKLPEYTANAKALGSTIQQMYESTTLYYQQGLNTQQAMGIATETMKMARIGGLEAADATDKMTAALRGFNMELNEASAQRVNDVYSNLAAKTASDTEELGTAMQRTASIAASAGMSFEGTAAFLAQAIETTREPAENLGTAMKTIVARFTELKKNPLEISEVDGEEVDYNKVDAALKSIGVSLKDTNGQFRDLDQVFLDISQRWDSLTQTQQRYVATQAAGSRQQSRFIAMMSNYERTVQLMDYANNSTGASAEQFGKTMESLEAKINILKDTWQEFLMNIANEGAIKGGVSGANLVLTTVNKIVDTISKATGPLSGLTKSVLSLGLAFGGLRLTGRLGNGFIRGFGGMIDPTTSFGEQFKMGVFNSRQSLQAAAISNPIVNAIKSLIPHIDKAAEKPVGTSGDLKTAQQDLRSSMYEVKGEKYLSKGKLLNGRQAILGGYSPQGILDIIDKNGLDAKQQKKLFNSNPGLKKNLKNSLGGLLEEVGADKEVKKKLVEGFASGSMPLKDILNSPEIPKTWGQQYQEILDKYGSNAWKQGGEAREAIKALKERSGAESVKDLRKGGKLYEASDNPEGAQAVSAWIGQQRSLTEAEQKTQNMVENGQKFGTTMMAVGMAFSMVGSAVGEVNESLGTALTTMGTMATTAGAVTSGLTGLANLGVISAGAILPVAAATTALVGVITLVKKYRESIKEAGKEVRDNFEKDYTQKGEGITTLENSKVRFKELSEGVDQYGHNISLTNEEFEEYRTLSREIAQLAPSLIAGYNAEGEAILKKGAAIDEVIKKQKEEQKTALKDYTASGAIDKQLKEYRLSDAYKDNKRTESSTATIQSFSGQRNAMYGAATTGGLSWDMVSQAMEDLGLGSSLSADTLSQAQLVGLSDHYDDVINLIKEKNPDIEEATLDSLRTAFQGTNEAISDVLAEGQPITDAFKLWMGQEKIDAAGLGIGEEFANSFNTGLEGVMLTGLTNEWDANTFKTQLRSYAKDWEDLAGSGSDYTAILEKAKTVQDEFLNSAGNSENISQYNKDITESCNELIKLAENTDTATEAGKAFQQQCIEQANALRNFTTTSDGSLSEALNTIVDDIDRAESALENFNEATKTDLYTAAEGMKSIYDKASETYEDSFGDKIYKHFEGSGDRTAWEAGRALLSENVLKNIDNGEQLKEAMDKWEPALREGEEGWTHFVDTVANDKDIQKALDELGVKFNDTEVDIPADKWDDVAKAIGISEEMLTSMLNKGRQFADLDFTNWNLARHEFETSTGIKGTANSTNESGKTKLLVKESTFEAALADANYKPEEFEGKKTEAEQEQNIALLKSINEYEKNNKGISTELSDLFRKDMGFNSTRDLVQAMVETGDYTREEIKGYSEAAGYETANFDTLYDSIADAIENPELYKQTSVLEKISGQIALLGDEGTTREKADQDLADYKDKIYGEKGADTEAQKFAYGQTKEGERLTEEQYAATKQSIEAQKVWAENQMAEAQARAVNADTDEEAEYWTNMANEYQTIANSLDKYLGMAAIAMERWSKMDSETQNATNAAKELVTQKDLSDQAVLESIKESAQSMADSGMKPEEIAAAIKQSYGVDTSTKDYQIGEDGKIKVTLDEEGLAEQLKGYKAELDAIVNIVDVRYGGPAAATGQNNPNSVFHRHGTMARGSKKGYVIPGRPTLTGEEGEELVWEPKRNQAYMVGSNGPQFANISKDAVVWNAEQTKRIKKNGKTSSLGTGARGIYRFGTMAGGRFGTMSGGTKIPGTLSLDAIADIQEVTPPVKEPTIPVKADLQVENGDGGGLLSRVFGGQKGGPSIDVAANVTAIQSAQQQTLQIIGKVVKLDNDSSISKIDATATVTQVTKAPQVAGEPISVKATAVVNKTSSTSTIKTTADNSAQQSINNIHSNKTVLVKTKADNTAQRAIDAIKGRTVTIHIKPSFEGTWTKNATVHVNHAAKGQNNYITYHKQPSFNSAAKGYGTVGPKNKGGLTLTGEEGFEIAWLPNENRSMILGAKGPQMLNLPGDAVVWTHEQSKKILKQQAIPAGSHAQVSGEIKTNKKYTDSGSSDGSGGGAKQTAKNNKDTADNNKKAKEVVDKVARISTWWENMTRKVDATQRNVDKTLSKFEKVIQLGGKSSTRANADAIGKEYATNLNQIISLSQAQIEKANTELKNLNSDSSAKSQKGKKKQYKNGAENIAQISYSTKKGKSKQKYVNIGQYIKEEGGTYVVDEAKARKKIKNSEELQATIDAANKEINDRLQKLHNAEDALTKAQEALDKLADDTYEAFDQWDKTITQVYLLGKRLEQLSKEQSVYDSAFDSEISRLSAGFGNAADSMERIGSALTYSRELMTTQAEAQSNLVQASFEELQSLTDLDTYYQKTVGSNPDSKKAQADYEMMKETLNFLKSTGLDGDNFDYSKAIEEIEKQRYSNAAYDNIKNGLDKIYEADQAYTSNIDETYKLIGSLYDKLGEYQAFISEFEHNLLDGIEEQTKSEIDKLDKLNSSLSKAYKDLLDEVKKKLDERRQKEDNQKTESDISKKQQRLTMLQADTAGGHQVEIAQLQQEIADAQQNYQRSLEDQLLEKLQNQADEAEKQRQRQIELLEGQNELAAQTGSNLEEVKKLLAEGNYDEIRKIYYEKNNYDNVTPEEQKKIAAQFEADLSKYLGYTEQISYLKSLDSNLLKILHETDKWAGIQSGTNHLLQERNQLQSQIDELRKKEETVSPETQAEIDKLQKRIDEINSQIEENNTNTTTSNNVSGIGQPEIITESKTEEEDKAKAAQSQAKAQSQQATQTPQDAYKNYMNARKKEKKLSSAQINELFKLGAAIGKGKGTVISEIVGGKGADPFTWKNIMKALLDANGVNRWNLLKTFPKNTDLQNALTKYLNKSLSQIKSGDKWKKAKSLGFSTGGLANYTGPAWLDGTPSKPELVLNARDTENFIALKDVLSKAVNSTNSIDNSYTGDNIFEININVDKIEKDYDVDRVIEKVKKEITKGAGYRNVTQVRNFR